MTTDTTTKIEDIPPAELEASLRRSVVTRIESHGELVYEPGMSREEEAARTRDVMWRHGGEARVREWAALNVAEGYRTQEQADAHVRRQEEQAKNDRAFVARADAERAARLAGSVPPRDDGPSR